MNNILIEYMKKRLQANQNAKSAKASPGPVVTISREYGCPAKSLATMIVSKVNQIELESYSKHKWKWIGKEVMEESARELHLNPQIVRDIMQSDEQNVIDEIVLSLSHKYYPGNHKIIKTIKQFIYSIASNGHVIIVGRGGVAITTDILNTLHIKIIAPMDWRINTVSKKQEISLKEAEKKIKNIDRKRSNMIDHFFGSKMDNSIFDVVFNYMRLDKNTIIDAIVKIMMQKNMI